MIGIWAGGGLLFLLTTALGGVWLYRGRASRRLHAAADAYANRELARTPRRTARRSAPGRPIS